MGNRFGRKKRRQARETIENLSSALQHAAKSRAELDRLNHSQERRLREMRQRIADWDSRVRYLLGPYTSAGINDVTYRVDDPYRIREMPVMPRRLTPADIACLVLTPTPSC